MKSIHPLHANGRRAFDEAMSLEAPWIRRISERVTLKYLEAMRRVMLALRTNLEADGNP